MSWFTELFQSKEVLPKAETLPPLRQNESVKSIIDSVSAFEPRPIAQAFRHPHGSQDGGKICADHKQVDRIRSIGGQMIKEIGRKLLKGDLNLTKISFPIKACQPKTALSSALSVTYLFPLYLNKATTLKDPIERMRLVVTALTCYPFFLDMFLKPLNPILGETLQATYPDGSRIYVQQISHHPPISYLFMIGPNDSYRFSAYFDFQAKASLNSAKLINSGKKSLIFEDGQKIDSNFPNTEYSGIFVGDIRECPFGQVKFQDKSNMIQCSYKYGQVKGKPQDYFQGTLKLKNKLIDKIQGSPFSHLDFGNKRYFDAQTQAFIPTVLESQLLSDHSLRADLQSLKRGEIEKAQEDKQQLQQKQRRDAKLRKKK